MTPADHPLDDDFIRQETTGLRSLVRALLGPGVDPEDVLQETWLAALRTLRPERVHPAAWLRGIARNVVRHARRRERRRAIHENDALPAPPQQATADTVVAVEQLRRLIDAIDALGDPYRDAIILRYLHGLPPRDVAARTGEPVGTVKTRLKRGLERLRRTLDSSFGGDRASWVLAFSPLLGDCAAPTLSTTASLAAAATIGGATMKIATGTLTLVLLVAVMIVVQQGGGTPDGAAMLVGSDRTAVRPADDPPSTTSNFSAVAPVVTSAFDPNTDEARTVGRDEVRVLVVAQETGAPLSGATLTAWDRGPVTRSPDVALLATDLDWGYQRLTPTMTATTGSDGVATLHHLPEARLTANAPGRWRAWSPAEGRTSLLRLELGADLTLQVRVENSSGHGAADVPVRITQSAVGLPRGDVYVGTTDSSGCFTARHLQQWRSMVVAGRMFAVHLGPEFPDAPPTEIDLDHLPIDPIVLKLPETGQLVVDATDEDGNPLRGTAYAGITSALVESNDHDPHGWERGTSWREVRDGRCVFPTVALGGRFLVRLHALDHEHALASVEVAGPTTAGEKVHVSLAVGARKPVIVARLVDEANQPIANHVVYVAPARAGSAVFDVMNSARARTDSNGCLRVPVDDRAWVVPGARLALMSRDFGNWRDHTQPRSTTVKLPSESPQPRDIAFGTVVMEPVPCLVSGVVRDDLGSAVPNARLRIDARWTTAQAGASTDSRDPTLVGATDDDGRFAIYAPVDDGEFQLSVEGDDAPPSDPTPFRAGAGNVVVRVPRAAVLEGSLLLPDGVPGIELFVEIRGSCAGAPSTGGHPAAHAADRVDSAGTFRIRGLQSGMGVITVSLAGLHTPIDPVVFARVDGTKFQRRESCGFSPSICATASWPVRSTSWIEAGVRWLMPGSRSPRRTHPTATRDPRASRTATVARFSSSRREPCPYRSRNGGC